MFHVTRMVARACMGGRNVNVRNRSKAAIQSAQREFRDLYVVRAVAGEVAFEEDEAVDREWREARAGCAEGMRRPLALAAVPAGEGDVRVESAVLGLEAGG